MDQVKIGQFLAQLRREAGLTQEALGERIGVTNKTISRWENGNYMPDIEMLQLLGQVYDVSVNELLAGQRLAGEKAFRAQAEQNVVAAMKESIFSSDEQRRYWKSKWRREHRALLSGLAIVTLGFAVVPWLIHRPWLAGLAPLVGAVAYGYQNNRMMTYVENQLYGSADEKRAHG